MEYVVIGGDMAIAPSKKASYSNKPPKKKGANKAIIAVASSLVLALAGIAVWSVFDRHGEEGTAPKAERTKKNKKVREAAQTQASQNKAAIPVVKDAKPKPEVIGKTPTGLEYIKHVAQTNSDGVVVSRYQLSDGSWTRVVNLQSKDTLVFESALDNELALIATTPLTQPLPPMPPIGNVEKAFEDAIKRPIIINENDSEKVKELKQAVKDIRLQIADLLREGYTVTQILSEEQSLRTKNITFRRELQRELNEIYRTEGREAAESYMESANAKLEEHGVIPLSLPESGHSKNGNNWK